MVTSVVLMLWSSIAFCVGKGVSKASGIIK